MPAAWPLDKFNYKLNSQFSCKLKYSWNIIPIVSFYVIDLWRCKHNFIGKQTSFSIQYALLSTRRCLQQTIIDTLLSIYGSTILFLMTHCVNTSFNTKRYTICQGEWYICILFINFVHFIIKKIIIGRLNSSSSDSFTD